MRLQMVLLLALAIGCGPAGNVEERADTDTESAAEEAGSQTGTLVLAGSAVESPREYEVEIGGCQYSRSPGVLQITAYGTGARPGTLSLAIGPSAIGFEDGTYGGRFTLDEPRDDGRVLTHYGEIEAAVDVLEARRDGFPLAEIRARGTGESMEIEFTGECPTMGAG